MESSIGLVSNLRANIPTTIDNAEQAVIVKPVLWIEARMLLAHQCFPPLMQNQLASLACAGMFSLIRLGWKLIAA
jgi:hypothetical protein